MKKRMLSLILSLALIVSLLPARSAAADAYHNADGEINVIELTGVGTPELYCGGAMLPAVLAVPAAVENELDSAVQVTWVKAQETEDSTENVFEATGDAVFEAGESYGLQIQVRAAGSAVFAAQNQLQLAIYRDYAADDPGRISASQLNIVSADTKTVTFIVNFGEAPENKKTIERIDVTGVTDPQKGGAAVVPENYEVKAPSADADEDSETPVEELQYAVFFEAAWVDEDGQEVASDSTFEENKKYTIGFNITAGENYMFSPKTSVFINGKRIVSGLPVATTTQWINAVYEKQSDINNTTLTFDAASYSDADSEDITFSATLKDRDGAALEGRMIRLYLNDTSITALQTNAEGTVSFALVPDMESYRVGSYSITAAYGGEAGYEVAEASAALVIRGEEEEMPTVTFELAENEKTGTMIGVDAEMKYSFDGTTFTDIEYEALEGADPDRNRLTVEVPEEAEALYVVRKGTGKLTTDSKPLTLTITRKAEESSSEETSKETTKAPTKAPETTKATTKAPETTKATTAAPIPMTQIITVPASSSEQKTSIPATTIPASIVVEEEEESSEETLEEASTEKATTKPSIKESATQATETTAHNDDDDIRKNAVRLIIIIAVIFVVVCILIAVLFYLNEQKPKKNKVNTKGKEPK